MTTQEILENHGLDFNVSKRPLFDADLNPTEYFGLFNDKLGKCINTVKAGYQVSQNKDIVDHIMKGVKPFDATLRVQKAGAINEGRKVFLQLGIEGDGVMGNDRIKRYITVVDSNDGSSGLGVGVGDLTMSCQNQFFKFYKASQFRMRHTAGLEERMQEIPTLIEGCLTESYKRMEIYRHLAETSIHSDIAHKFVREMIGYDRKTDEDLLKDMHPRTKKTMDTLYDCLDVEMKSKGTTAWGLHSGLTRFTTHHKPTRKRENADMEALMFGSVYNMNQKSLDFAMALS